jgi:hypothetical protein
MDLIMAKISGVPILTLIHTIPLELDLAEGISTGVISIEDIIAVFTVARHSQVRTTVPDQQEQATIPQWRGAQLLVHPVL